jgi:predicted  nucleic acid-binding Zn-ribbon protein
MLGHPASTARGLGNDAADDGLNSNRKEPPLALELETLKSERDQLKENLRELETEQRKLEQGIKALRQRELKTKREIEALSTLIELAEAREKNNGDSE